MHICLGRTNSTYTVSVSYRQRQLWNPGADTISPLYVNKMIRYFTVNLPSLYSFAYIDLNKILAISFVVYFLVVGDLPHTL